MKPRDGKAQARCRALMVLIACLPFLSGCGSGSSSAPPPNPAQNLVPILNSLSPDSVPAGSRRVLLDVFGSNFVRSSLICWEGVARATTFMTSEHLTTVLNPAEIAAPGIRTVAVLNPAPGGGMSTTQNFTITTVAALAIEPAQLPDAYHGKPYSYTFQASGGIPPYTWLVEESTPLPRGLHLSAGGTLMGAAPHVPADEIYDLTVLVRDSAENPQSVSVPVTIRVVAGSSRRNDSCETATPISNGLIRASISPYGDVDVYSFRGTAGAPIQIETIAQRLDVNNHLDTFLELLDARCQRLHSNDDLETGDSLDSFISTFLPADGAYYIRVSDSSGGGRPDFPYQLRLSGAD